MDEENRLKITLWLKPGIVRRMDGWLEEDNCKSRGEFAEKALRFYMGYLATEDTSEYLSRALVDTLRGTLTDNENRLRTLLFKLCVEVNMMGITGPPYALVIVCSVCLILENRTFGSEFWRPAVVARLESAIQTSARQ